MSETKLLRDAGLKENVEITEGDFLRGGNFTRGTFTLFRTGFTDERLSEGIQKVSLAEVMTIEAISPPESSGSRVLGMFGMLGGAVSGGLAAADANRPQKHLRIGLKDGRAFKVRAEIVRVDMILKQWKEHRDPIR